MTDSWSLVLFTLLGQSAAGFMILLALGRSPVPAAARRSWIALAVLAVAVLCSLAHLASPLLSPLSLTNVMSSWLSREILTAGLFGVSILAFVLTRRGWLLWLSAVLGAVFVLAMSRVYLIPTEALWNTPLTVWAFLVTAILLGTSILLLLDVMTAGRDRCCLFQGKTPFILIGAALVRLVVLFLQKNAAGAEIMPYRALREHFAALEIAQFCLLLVGIGLALLLSRRASRLSADATEASTDTQTYPVCGSRGIAVLTVAVVWAAELCGRLAFYQKYVWFGM